MPEIVDAERPKFRIDSEGNYVVFFVGLFGGMAINSEMLDDNGRKEYFELDTKIDEVGSQKDNLKYTRNILAKQNDDHLMPAIIIIDGEIQNKDQIQESLTAEQKTLPYRPGDSGDGLEFMSVGLGVAFASAAIFAGIRYGVHRYRYRNHDGRPESVIDSSA